MKSRLSSPIAAIALLTDVSTASAEDSGVAELVETVEEMQQTIAAKNACMASLENETPTLPPKPEKAAPRDEAAPLPPSPLGLA